ncbi:hypothetical protein ACHQM5_020416 [Ranunculus cassubicifolius]
MNSVKGAASTFKSSLRHFYTFCHEEWTFSEDELALKFLRPDLVLFTGDIGNENVELVRSVASLQMPKAVILGNHDSWGTQKFSSNLGEEHVGYSRLDFPMLKLSVVGGRPFSCGGEQLFRKKLLKKRYGIKDMDASAEQISKAALGTPTDHLVILLAHNGPAGLGSNVNDICGKDWDGGGDHGDPDLAQAISKLKETVELPLVVFGHMHKELENGNRKMTLVGDDNTVYVNGAIVPRVKELVGDRGKGTSRAFTIIDFFNGRLSKIAETWVSLVGGQTAVEDEQILFTSSLS